MDIERDQCQKIDLIALLTRAGRVAMWAGIWAFEPPAIRRRSHWSECQRTALHRPYRPPIGVRSRDASLEH